jgi:hypothetical protein
MQNVTQTQRKIGGRRYSCTHWLVQGGWPLELAWWVGRLASYGHIGAAVRDGPSLSIGPDTLLPHCLTVRREVGWWAKAWQRWKARWRSRRTILGRGCPFSRRLARGIGCLPWMQLSILRHVHRVGQLLLHRGRKRDLEVTGRARGCAMARKGFVCSGGLAGVGACGGRKGFGGAVKERGAGEEEAALPGGSSLRTKWRLCSLLSRI